MIDQDSNPDLPVWTRRWLVAFVPLVVFGQSWFVEFGLRDDYSILREAREEPSKVVAFCAAQGRFLYGLLLEASFWPLDGVNELIVGRVLSTLCVGLAGALVARALTRHLRWRGIDALLMGALLTMLPATQVIANWAICWPHAFAGLLGVAAFSVAEEGLASAGARRTMRLFAALAVMIAGILTYQSNVLLYLVPVAAGWLGLEARRGWRWLGAHLGLVGVALGSSYLLTLLLFAVLDIRPSDRVAIEWHWGAKFAWAVANPLREGLGLYALRDALGRTEPWYSVAQMLTVAAITTALLAPARRDIDRLADARASGADAALAAWLESLRADEPLGRAVGSLAILGATYAVSFVAIERWAAYRTIWPLTGVLLVAAYLGTRRWLELAAARRPLARRVAMATAVAGIALSAAWNVRTLLIEPQVQEWARMRQLAAHYNPSTGGRVFVVLPRLAETATPLRHLDEFGSLSGDSDWAAKEMFKQALRAQHPDLRDAAARLVWQSGDRPPAAVPPSRVIDLRRATAPTRSAAALTAVPSPASPAVRPAAPAM